MKTFLLLSLIFASSLSIAGTLTIVPDSTSSMGLKQQRRELNEKRQAARQARIDAGIERPPTVIIVRQRPQSIQMNCYSYGNRNQYTSCQQE